MFWKKTECDCKELTYKNTMLKEEKKNLEEELEMLKMKFTQSELIKQELDQIKLKQSMIM